MKGDQLPGDRTITYLFVLRLIALTAASSLLFFLFFLVKDIVKTGILLGEKLDLSTTQGQASGGATAVLVAVLMVGCFYTIHKALSLGDTINSHNGPNDSDPSSRMKGDSCRDEHDHQVGAKKEQPAVGRDIKGYLNNGESNLSQFPKETLGSIPSDINAVLIPGKVVISLTNGLLAKELRYIITKDFDMVYKHSDEINTSEAKENILDTWEYCKIADKALLASNLYETYKGDGSAQYAQ